MQPITPKQSLWTGAVWSLFIGLLLSLMVCMILRLTLGVGFIGLIIFVPLAILAGLSAFAGGGRTVPFQMRGVGLTFGHVNGNVYDYGDQWAIPFIQSILVVPGPDQEYSLKIGEDTPEAKDKIPVIIGRGRKSVLQLKIVDPLRYAAVQNREVALEASFLNQLREFVNRMNFAAGILDEKSLIERFMELRPFDPSDTELVREYAELENRLIDLRVERLQHDQTKKMEHVFGSDTDYSPVETLMEQAGTFYKEALSWGIKVVNMFAPSIDLPEDIEAAARKKQIQQESSEQTTTKIDNLVNSSVRIRDELGVTGEDAADRYALMMDNPNVSRHVYGIPGLREGLEALAGAVAGKMSQSQGGQGRSRRRRNRNKQQPKQGAGS